MSIDIIPTGAALGAEIRGVNLAKPLDEPRFVPLEVTFGYQVAPDYVADLPPSTKST
jgi:hypothetical protein